MIITIINLNENKGLNIAVLEVYREALRKKSDFIIKMDTDGENTQSKFPELLAEIMHRSNKIELVFFSGKKDGAGFRIFRSISLSRKIKEIESEVQKKNVLRGIDRITNKIFGINAYAYVR